MGILDAPPVDAVTKKALSAYTPIRDIPGCKAWFDASTLTGANGSNITRWDANGGSFSLNVASTTPPTLLTNGANGKNVVRFGTTGFLKNTDTFGVSGAVPSSGYGPPSTLVMVARLSSGATMPGSTDLFGGPGHKIALHSSSVGPYLYAGTQGGLKSHALNDGQWHVIVGQVGGAAGATLYVDGYVADTTITTVGTQAISSLIIGPGMNAVGLTAGTFDVAELIVGDRLLTPGQVDAVSKYLGAKWGISQIGSQPNGVHYVDATDSGGQPIRYWLPPKAQMGSSTPLIIWCHQYTNTEQITTGYWSYPMIHAAVQQGYMVVASRMHGDNWGNDAALTDVVNAYNFMNAIQPVSSVVLTGASMGGLGASLTVAKGNLPAGKVKGVYLVDAVFDLQWAYTANANGFQTSINTAYGATSYATIPAGHDPIRSFTASAYTGVRWRFSASVNDTNVTKTANTDPFQALVAGAPEASIITHVSNHTTSTSPSDFIAFCGRCGL